MASTKPIPLDALLTAVAGQVTLFGHDHDVLALNAREYQLLDALEAGTIETSDPLWAAIRRLVPSLTDEERGALTFPIAGQILIIAAGLAKAVEDALPNSSGPTTTIPTPATTSESPVT